MRPRSLAATISDATFPPCRLGRRPRARPRPRRQGDALRTPDARSGAGDDGDPRATRQPHVGDVGRPCLITITPADVASNASCACRPRRPRRTRSSRSFPGRWAETGTRSLQAIASPSAASFTTAPLHREEHMPCMNFDGNLTRRAASSSTCIGVVARRTRSGTPDRARTANVPSDDGSGFREGVVDEWCRAARESCLHGQSGPVVLQHGACSSLTAIRCETSTPAFGFALLGDLHVTSAPWASGRCSQRSCSAARHCGCPRWHWARPSRSGMRARCATSDDGAER